MKILTILLSLITLGGAGALAQGTIQFQNSSTFPIKIATGTDANSLATATLIGTDSTSVSLGAGPGQVTISLYVSLASAPNTFFLAGTTTNSGSSLASFQGTFHGGNPYTISASIDGGAFTQGTTIDYYFTAITSNNSYLGVLDATSDIGTGYVLAGGATTPGVTFSTAAGRIGGFTIVPLPEPSMIALGSLGAAALVLFRRCKQIKK